MSSVVKMRLVYALMVFFGLSVTMQMGLFLTHQLRDFNLQGIVIFAILFDLVIVYTFPASCGGWQPSGIYRENGRVRRYLDRLRLMSGRPFLNMIDRL